jgi:hypothetical protein
MNPFLRISPALLTVTLAACVHQPVSAPEPPPPTQAALDQMQNVRKAYDQGQYGDVIRMVAVSQDLAAAPADLQVESLKLQAFSYCVMKYRQLCEDSFVRILQIQPTFDLSAAERGQPQWGPAFREVKAAQGRGTSQ